MQSNKHSVVRPLTMGFAKSGLEVPGMRHDTDISTASPGGYRKIVIPQNDPDTWFHIRLSYGNKTPQS